LGYLALRAVFQGIHVGSDALQAAEGLREERAKERLEKFPSAVYLVVEAIGDKISIATDIARETPEAVIAFDALDKQAITAAHQPLVSAAVTALVLTLNTTPDAIHVLDGVELTLPDSRPLYTFAASGGAIRVMSARPARGDEVETFEKTVRPLLADNRLTTPSRLLVDALRSTDDRLEAFIFAWAALEVLIGKQMTKCESGAWIVSAPDRVRATAEELHRQVLARCRPYYSFLDRTKAFCLLNGLDAEAITAEIAHLRTTFREPLYHSGQFEESALPVDAVINLVRRLMASIVDRTSRGN